MKVLLTGQVGLNKGDYLKGVKNLIDHNGKKFCYETTGEKMIESYTGKIDDRTILNLPKVVLDLLRRFAWKDILSSKQLNDSNDNIFVINTHAVFRWHHGLFPGIDLDLIADFSPHIVATLIDDVNAVKELLKQRGTDFFELWEILAWREEEIWLTKFLVDSLRKLSGNS